MGARHFSDYELDKIRELNQKNYNDSEIAHELGRSIRGVSRARNRMKLPLRYDITFTEQEIKLIKELHSQGFTAIKIGENLKRSPRAISNHLSQFGLRTVNSHFTPNEINFIKERFMQGYSDEEIARKINRSPGGVRRRRIKMGLSYHVIQEELNFVRKYHSQGYSDRQIAHLLNKGENCIYYNRHVRLKLPPNYKGSRFINEELTQSKELPNLNNTPKIETTDDQVRSALLGWRGYDFNQALILNVLWNSSGYTNDEVLIQKIIEKKKKEGWKPYQIPQKQFRKSVRSLEYRFLIERVEHREYNYVYKLTHRTYEEFDRIRKL
ncbi:hypothetical protein J4221_06150 [Candidatus Pacearchaeota archaeon]|nr:hypothetical protein [Candidatus Pacearchaeota archaeon]